MIPCGCCPTGSACFMTANPFAAVAQTQLGAAGWSDATANLPLTIDGITNSAALSGYNTPGGLIPPQPTPQVTYTVPAKNGVIGVRLWNQGGGNLNDADGLGSFVADFYAGATLLASLSTTGVNGGAPTNHLLPAALAGVDRVVLRDLGKQTASGAAPLWRELQLLTVESAYSCRTSDGVLHWYDQNGNSVAAADIVSCPQGSLGSNPQVPLAVSNLVLGEAALGDDNVPVGEALCNVVPAPTSFTGFTLAGGCYDGSLPNTDTMTWAGPVSSITMEYSSQGFAGAGAALINFQAPQFGGFIQWVGNAVPLLPGESRRSLPFTGGYAVLTYIGGGVPAGAPRFDGNPNIRIGPAAIQNFGVYQMRIDFYAA